MLVHTGGVYRARSGKQVGPLRPFRDETDGLHTDILGRSAMFFADGVGAFDRAGEWLTGGIEGPNDLIAEWNGLAPIDGHISREPGDRDLTVGTAIPLGTLLAEVRVLGAEVRVDKAWLEASAEITIPLDGQAVDAFGVFNAGRWRSFRSIIAAAALAEARA